MEECIFCKIVKGETDTNIVTQTDNLIVFPGIHPSAPTHFLIIPKKHIPDMTQAEDILWLEIRNLATQMAKERNLIGFRLATNTGTAAAVKHMHVHFLAGIDSKRAI